jgi:hypothetical protein
MILLKDCCRGRWRCARMNPRAALAHAAQRSRRTGRDQHIRHINGMWRITEAPPRREEKRS